MKLFKVRMYNRLTKKIETSYIESKTARSAMKDLECFRSDYFSPVDSTQVTY